MESSQTKPLLVLENRSRRDTARYGATGFEGGYYPFANDYFETPAEECAFVPCEINPNGAAISIGSIGACTADLPEFRSGMLVLDTNPRVVDVSKRVRNNAIRSNSPEESIQEIEKGFPREVAAFRRERDNFGKLHWTEDYDRFRRQCGLGYFAMVGGNVADRRFVGDLRLSLGGEPRITYINMTNVHQYIDGPDILRGMLNRLPLNPEAVVHYSELAHGGLCRISYARGTNDYLQVARDTVGSLKV